MHWNTPTARPRLRAVMFLVAGTAVASLALVATGWGGSTASRGFSTCRDDRGYLYIPGRGTCPPGSEVVWNGEIPAVAEGAKSLTKDALVHVQQHHSHGTTVKDAGGWSRTTRYVAKCPLEHVAVAGAYSVDWPYVYDVNVVTSRPRVLQGSSAWEVLAVTAAPTNKPPKAVVHVDAVCLRRTAIFPSG
jgi:hypothetical protein